jgi:hypothetical protein
MLKAKEEVFLIHRSLWNAGRMPSIACAGTHSFCLDEWLDTVQSVLQLPNKTPGFQNGGKQIDVGMISLYLSQ